MESEAIKPDIIPGDFILIQTPGTLYSNIRKVLDVSYDHIAVLLDKDTVLHISPPNIRKISSNVFLMKKRNPLIIRANMTALQRDTFLHSLENTIGEKYDYQVLFNLLGKKIYHEFSKNLTKNKDPFQLFELLKENKPFLKNNKEPFRICTDLFFYKLKEIYPEFSEIIKTSQNNLNYSYLGSFSPDDLLILAENNPNILKAIHCYPMIPIKVLNPLENLEFKKDNSEQDVNEPIISSGINFKKIINVIDKLLFLTNLKQNLTEYRKGLSRISRRTMKNKREAFQAVKLVYLLYGMRKLLKGLENKSLSLTHTKDLLKQGLEIYLVMQYSELNNFLKRPFARAKL